MATERTPVIDSELVGQYKLAIDAAQKSRSISGVHPPRKSHAILCASLAACLLLSVTSTSAQAVLARNAEERAIAKLAANHHKQRRPRLAHDAYLHLVARARALDLARRDYFSHVDPDGIGPNRLISMTGYALPSHYSKSRNGNNVESIAAGTHHTPRSAFQAWMKSPGHRTHLLASESFYRSQTRFGVGYARSAGSKFKNYYVFISAPPSTKRLPTLSKGKTKLFLTKTPRQVERTQAKSQ